VIGGGREATNVPVRAAHKPRRRRGRTYAAHEMSPMLRERPLRQESAAACGCKALPRAIKLGRMEDIPQDARFPA
jgi:hypothetical protein